MPPFRYRYILIKKVQRLLDATSVFEENDYFWSQRKMDTIPFSFLKRIGCLNAAS